MNKYIKGGGIAALVVALVWAAREFFKKTKDKVVQSPSGFPTAQEYNATTGRVKKDTLTVRANNPGAIFHFGDDWQGLDKERSAVGEIAYFDNVDNGIRAHVKTLWTYYTKHELRTPAAIIGRYAPPSAHNNDTDAYTRFVSDSIKVNRDQTLDFQNDRELFARFAWAQHVMEAGFAWVEYADYLNWTKKMQ